jgi:hypothetical protein
MNNYSDEYIFAMYLMFLRAPGLNTLPGECVDLDEIGEVGRRIGNVLRPTALWNHQDE